MRKLIICFFSLKKLKYKKKLFYLKRRTLNCNKF